MFYGTSQGKNVSKEIKKNTVHRIVESAMLYGCKIGPLREKLAGKIKQRRLILLFQ
jgi:hypothetical protein